MSLKKNPENQYFQAFFLKVLSLRKSKNQRAGQIWVRHTTTQLDFDYYGNNLSLSNPGPRQTEIEYGTVLGGTTMDFFSKSTIPTYNRMWEFMVSRRGHVFVNSTSEGVHRVRSTPGGRYAFLVESPIAEYAETRYDQRSSVIL